MDFLLICIIWIYFLDFDCIDTKFGKQRCGTEIHKHIRTGQDHYDILDLNLKSDLSKITFSSVCPTHFLPMGHLVNPISIIYRMTVLLKGVKSTYEQTWVGLTYHLSLHTASSLSLWRLWHWIQTITTYIKMLLQGCNDKCLFSGVLTNLLFFQLWGTLPFPLCVALWDNQGCFVCVVTFEYTYCPEWTHYILKTSFDLLCSTAYGTRSKCVQPRYSSSVWLWWSLRQPND